MTALDQDEMIYAKIIITEQLPRLLTQIDRNQHSPTYGCCCRNHWHYRIEDIPNSQFQELVLALAIAYRLDANWNKYYQSPQLLEWASAAIEFWTKIQRPSGAFEEVYRGHDSFAGTAFTTFTVTEATLLLRDQLDPDLVRKVTRCAEKASNWLCSTEEDFAANQISGAAAAVLNTATLSNNKIYLEKTEVLLARLQSHFCDEGWFNEYGGADIGYASLTQSYLALVVERGGFEQYRPTLDKATEFLSCFIHADGTVGGEYGSRFTEYFIPLGMLILSGRNESALNNSKFLAEKAVEGRYTMFSKSLDDRYLSYLSPYFMMTALLAQEMKVANKEAERPKGLRPHQAYFERAKLLSFANSSYRIIVSAAKGGVFRFESSDKLVIDSGLFCVDQKNRTYASQQLNQDAEIEWIEENKLRIVTDIVQTKPIVVNPLKVLLVKTFNLLMPALLRRKFLDFLRTVAVSSGRKIGKFQRVIELRENEFVVRDEIRLNKKMARVTLQATKEKVFSFASTGFFQEQELKSGNQSQVITLDENNCASVERTYAIHQRKVVGYG